MVEEVYGRKEDLLFDEIFELILNGRIDEAKEKSKCLFDDERVQLARNAAISETSYTAYSCLRTLILEEDKGIYLRHLCRSCHRH